MKVLLVVLFRSLWSSNAFLLPLPTQKSPLKRLINARSSFSRLHSKVLNQNLNTTDVPLQRFERTASSAQEIDEPCIITIGGVGLNLTSWAKAHPGGEAVLKRFHGRDATKAFEAAHHSKAAYAMLKDFRIDETEFSENSKDRKPSIPRWRAKLFTSEDPIGVHKILGVFCLLHFAFRYFQMYFGDPSAGLGTRLGQGPSWIPLACLVPHVLLSMSSLLFKHVPRDRVVGKPMIWQEYRVHNIVFGIRSIIAAALCSIAIHYGNTASIRKVAVWGSCTAVLLTNVLADLATYYLRSNQFESTTATMPYWEGCSIHIQKRFKTFYAFSQFNATLACLAVMNPAWPVATLFAIQLASLLMTLVRKGFLSTKGSHYFYTASLIVPYFAGIRGMIYSKTFELPALVAVGYILYQARRRGVNKYALWLPVIVARITIGDRFLNWSVW